MKTKQEQIEEMAVIGCTRVPQAHTAEECRDCYFKEGQCNAYRHAEADIREREKYERWLSRQSDMLEEICRERGIKLWE